MVHEPPMEREPRMSARPPTHPPPQRLQPPRRESVRERAAPRQDRPPAPRLASARAGRAGSPGQLMVRPGPASAPAAPACEPRRPRSGTHLGVLPLSVPRASHLAPPGRPGPNALRAGPPAGPRRAAGQPVRNRLPSQPGRALDGLIAAPLPSVRVGGRGRWQTCAPLPPAMSLCSCPLQEGWRTRPIPALLPPRRNHFYYLVYFPPDVTAGLIHSRSQLLLSPLYPLGVPARLMHSRYRATALPSAQLLLFCLFSLQWGCKTNALLIPLFLLPQNSSCGCSAAWLLLPQQRK